MLKFIKHFRARFTGRQQTVLCCLFALLLLCVTAAVAQIMSRSSPLLLNVPKGGVFESAPLIAYDSGAKSKILHGTATYKFTQKQAEGIKAFVLEHGDGALTLLVRREEAALGGLFSFCYVHDGGSYDKSFSPLVTCDMAKGSAFRLTLSFGKDKSGEIVIPAGFTALSEEGVHIEEAVITRAAIGYDKSSDIEHYAFCAVGGKVDTKAEGADFSSGAELFPAQNGLLPFSNTPRLTAQAMTGTVMPKIIIKLAEEEAANNGAQAKCALNFGGEQFTLWRHKGADSLTVYAASVKTPFSMARVEGAKVKTLMMISSDKELSPDHGRVLEPYKTDPGFIISWPQETWRSGEYELFEWDRFPKVLFMDFSTYKVQSAFLRRLAFFVEKKGYRGTLASDEVLKDKHDYNAHDYRDESLAEFYSKAQAEDFPLNDSEMLLKDILLHNGVIKEAGTGYVAGGGALISVSKQSEPWLRDRLLSHEGWHGVYFTNERFRNAVAAVYGTMDERSRDFLEQYWGTQEGLGYDTSDEYLTKNEFMAYLMQQRLGDTASYFVHLANRGSVMRGIPELCRYVRDTGGRAFEDAARVLNEYALDNFGLECGRISLVRQ